MQSHAWYEEPPKVAREAVLVPSESSDIPPEAQVIKGYDFNKGCELEGLLSSMVTTGFQASHLGQAMDVVNQMRKWRLSDEPIRENDDITDPEERKKVKCTIFLGYTSNMISCGVRETIKFLVQHKMKRKEWHSGHCIKVDCIVSSAGGVEEDLIKCMAPTYLGRFDLNGTDLRRRGLNRIGNMLVPNDNYCKFEDWITPVLDQMLKEQEEDGMSWTPSAMIDRFGKEINHEDSVLYWAHKNQIPIFSPAITDGSIGDMIYFHSYRSEKKIVIDIAADIRNINNIAVFAPKTGMIIIGGGLVKHHICNANLMRNGADYAVFINTGQEFDGSDSGARPEEAISWGKIRGVAHPVKVYTEATIAFPLLVAATFAKDFHASRNSMANRA